ncbi:PhaM family polyhydroxyalkanoate granule multifunctional regulatory protein [Paraburkholderia sacchari]|uniref:PhaM family polyhydroxyalkanoate granule multifunctional regulatory protein n=1 Tax=Paraburkholderia sacchari TaxID=159450 RepID=UPI0005426E02|nr:PhaM family polyhydroxyalkanoate granule multifunctional regulatory protein [Paraburkholderia sacchari]NLP61282.1 transcriptional regulator [Paraburkholderia sacchari]
MTESAGTVPPFPGFPGFPPAEMLDRMWGMMRLTPFGSAFPGSEPGAAQGLGPSLSMMSDMMTPLTNIEELDKRITDLRAVEQWLKLNLSMLQSAIQALEVQRATLSTLRAFGTFAQSQMSPSSTHSAPEPEPRAARAQPGAESAGAAGAGQAAGADDTTPPPGFDASSWWNLLQSQFNQLAQFAMAQPAAAAEAVQAAAEAAAPPAKPAAKRSSSGNSGGGSSAGKTAARGAKRPPAQPE